MPYIIITTYYRHFEHYISFLNRQFAYDVMISIPVLNLEDKLPAAFSDIFLPAGYRKGGFETVFCPLDKLVFTQTGYLVQIASPCIVVKRGYNIPNVFYFTGKCCGHIRDSHKFFSILRKLIFFMYSICYLPNRFLSIVLKKLFFNSRGL